MTIRKDVGGQAAVTGRQIEFSAPPIRSLLPELLVDHTTGCSITARDGSELTPDIVLASPPVMRVDKPKPEQKKRAKAKAEIFTPSWLVNRMLNTCEDRGRGHRNAFTREFETESEHTVRGRTIKHGWTPTPGPVVPGKTDWRDYVRTTVMEITCGEAPFLASRYDVVTGESIPLPCRMGVLDRKLRLVTENTDSESDWCRWGEESLQACYGFEIQGDSLLLARCNLLLDWMEHYGARFGQAPSMEVLRRLSRTIAGNVWQMDGLKICPPSRPGMKCRYMDWRNGHEEVFDV